MKVRIIKCSNALSWYNNKIGDIIDVDDIREDRYIADGFYGDGIMKSDCEIISDPKIKKVKCIDNNSDVDFWLTEGKKYNVLDRNQDQILVKNDQGFACWYFLKRFEIIEEDEIVIPESILRDNPIPNVLAKNKPESAFPEPIAIFKADIYKYYIDGENFQVIFVNGEFKQVDYNFKNPYTREQWQALSRIYQLIVHLELGYIEKELK